MRPGLPLTRDVTSDVRLLTVSGRVEAVGTDAASPSCSLSYATVPAAYASLSAAEASFISVRDADDVLWTVGTRIPGGLDAFAVGDAAEITFEENLGAASFAVTSTRISVTRDGEDVLWVAQAPTFEDVAQPPGYELSRGESICRESSPCGKWKWYRLAIRGAESGSAGWTEPARVGGDLVFNGGVVATTKSKGRCSDFGGSLFRAGVVYGAALGE